MTGPNQTNTLFLNHLPNRICDGRDSQLSGNIRNKTEITSLLIIEKLEQFNYGGAAAIAVVMLGASFLILLFINVLQWWTAHGHQKGV